MSGTTSEVEDHLYRGQTVTITCRDGEPVQEEGVQVETARAACQDERSDQRSGARTLLILGVLAVAYGTFELRKQRSG
jgi:hypothetical protein